MEKAVIDSGKRRKNAAAIMLVVAACVLIMAFIDGVVKPGYIVKSMIKAVLFLGSSIMLSWRFGGSLKGLFMPKRGELLRSIALGAAVYAIIVGGFFLTRSVFDFSKITSSLSESAGVSRANFIAAALYISFANSLLEEFFFRGFAYLRLSEYVGIRSASAFSALAFAVYHVAIMLGWFRITPFLLILGGLFIGGLLFNWLDRSGVIYSSWLVHMCANFAINTVGLILYGML